MRLYGKFRGLNLEGKAHTDGISFGIDYLNTKYIFADSLNFTNKGIAIKNKQVFDTYGNYAIVNGNIEYEYFKDIKYDININIPQNRPFLAFNVTEKINPIYWGTIFANGNAHIYGNEQETRIDVIGRSTGNSRLFFSLDNNLSANDYQFLTFRDKTVRPSVNIEEDDYIDFEDTESVSNHDLYLNLQVEATPEATVNLIMDPQTGDNIKGSGSGNLRLEYNKTNDFRIFGNYTIDKGNYYFNLQDVISRDFSIQHGSTVNFTGNPLNAQLNIKAIYQVTASLGDLDKSFSESKELSRLSVPVQCILNIDGDLRRPALSFDINLPTVSQDIDRQVKSIIATDEMMNRQIIYLMVLNKFYTPDYMAQNSQQNRYSDLTSVASSTLSSQLSNLLGQISDNWNIGTNIRSEKGDFSDVEVELALSSQLLNNRLLFNGNLGYRENQISDNKFIGDFDLE